MFKLFIVGRLAMVVGILGIGWDVGLYLGYVNGPRIDFMQLVLEVGYCSAVVALGMVAAWIADSSIKRVY